MKYQLYQTIKQQISSNVRTKTILARKFCINTDADLVYLIIQYQLLSTKTSSSIINNITIGYTIINTIAYTIINNTIYY